MYTRTHMYERTHVRTYACTHGKSLRAHSSWNAMLFFKNGYGLKAVKYARNEIKYTRNTIKYKLIRQILRFGSASECFGYVSEHSGCLSRRCGCLSESFGCLSESFGQVSKCLEAFRVLFGIVLERFAYVFGKFGWGRTDSHGMGAFFGGVLEAPKTQMNIKSYASSQPAKRPVDCTVKIGLSI